MHHLIVSPGPSRLWSLELRSTTTTTGAGSNSSHPAAHIQQLTSSRILEITGRISADDQQQLKHPTASLKCHAGFQLRDQQQLTHLAACMCLGNVLEKAFIRSRRVLNKKMILVDKSRPEV